MRDLKINQKKLETAASRFNNFGVSLAFVLSIGFSTTANSALLQACNSLTYTKVDAGLQFSIVKDVPSTCSWYSSSGYYGGSTEICFGNVSTCIIPTPTTDISVKVLCSDSTGSCGGLAYIPLAKPTCTLTAVASYVELGNSSTLTANCLPTPTTYVWTGGTCANNKTSSCTVTPSSSTTYTVKGYNSSGYGAVASATVKVVPATSPNVTTVVEFYLAGLNHYFMTANLDEATALDAVTTLPRWESTGKTWLVWKSATSSLSPVCRFFGTDKYDHNLKRIGANSHFYTADSAECDFVKTAYQTLANDGQLWPAWTYEENSFYAEVTEGACPSGTTPIYRLYNNGQGGEPNHRYYTDMTVKTEMLAKGWVIEPANGNPVMCGPSQ